MAGIIKCLTLVTACFLLCCSAEKAGTSEPLETAPAVQATVPDQGADMVATDVVIGISFTKSLKRDQDFAQLIETTAGVGRVSVQESSCSIIPNFNLAPFTDYRVTISRAIEFVDGQTLGNDFTWTFTTGPSDTLPGFPGP